MRRVEKKQTAINEKGRAPLRSLWSGKLEEKAGRTVEGKEKMIQKIDDRHELEAKGTFRKDLFLNALRTAGNFFFGYLFRRWVAGPHAENAIAYARKINALNSPAIINCLGEHYHEAKRVKETVAEYKRLVGLISAGNLNAAITIKPSQFGYDAEGVENNVHFCFANMNDIVEYAKNKNVFVWIDMESSRYIDFTLESYAELAKGNDRIGICLQANMKRTEVDLLKLIKASSSFPQSGKLQASSQRRSVERELPVKIRLVKGVYREKEEIGFTKDEDIHANFKKLIELAFAQSGKEFGIAVGSLHIERINEAVELQKKYQKEFFEIQVLKGVLPSLYKELRNRGIKVVEYVPYGKDAFAYSMRRAMKNPGFARMIIFAPFVDAYKKLYGKI